jgi:hypothetical protein
VTAVKRSVFDEGDSMEFRLTYEGSLLATTQRNNRVPQKHRIRQEFHKQLKRLWDIKPYLKSGQPVSFETLPAQPPSLPTMIPQERREQIARQLEGRTRQS